MDGWLISLLALLGGLALGYVAGKLAKAALPFVQQVSPAHFGHGASTLFLLAVIGAMLGYLIRTFFDHWAALLGALVAFLYVATSLLNSGD